MITYGQYMECGYYPHIQANWKSRFRIAWRILWHGEFFPAPPVWYESLFQFVHSPLSMCVKRAVEKVNLEHTRDKTPMELRMKEARQWLQIYATEQGLYQAGMREGTLRFLIEWHVAQIGGKF